jgi:type IV pilus assembly protein PilY1
MKTDTRYAHFLRLALLISGMTPFLAASAPLDIPEYPLFQASTGVPPNLVLTLDDSGSMAAAITPDRCANTNCYYPSGSTYHCDSQFVCGTMTNRYAKSATYNPMYYNPAVTYPAPPKGDAANTRWSTSFTSAHINGYDPNQRYNDPYYGNSSNPNLSTSYRPTAARFFSGGASAPNGNPYWTDLSWNGWQWVVTQAEPDHSFMTHYANDVSCRSSRCQVATGSGSSWTSVASTPSCSSNAQCQTRGVPAYYYVFNSTTTATCTGTTDQKKVDNDCYSIRVVGNQNGPSDVDGNGVVNGNDEKQNFANWYSFYRTRNLATIGAVSNAFVAQLPETTRLGWQALNTCRNTGTSNFVVSDCEGWQTTAGSNSNALKAFTGSDKTNFFSWLTRLPSSSGTPLRSALARGGSYFSTTSGNTSPYNNTPGDAASGQHSCRKNYQIVMTDGRWNTDAADLGFSNADGSQSRPFRDNNSDSLADISFYYWNTDLAPGLTNDVTTNIFDRHNCPSDTTVANYATTCPALYQDAKNNPQYKQHMVNFTIGFGLSDFLAQASPALSWGGDTYSGSYSNLVSGATSWPAIDPAGNGGNGNVADLWHAALNSRGRFYNTDGPESLNSAFTDILDNINSQSRAGGGAGAAASQVVLTGPDPNDPTSNDNITTVFSARFDSDMSGHIVAKEFNAADGTFGNNYWDAADLLPATTNRLIFTLNGGQKEAFSACTAGRPLTTALNLPPPLADGTQPAADNLCSQRLNWLRSTWLPKNGVVSAASWNSNVVSFTVVGHVFVTGDTVTISNVSPSGYNGSYSVTVSGNTLSASLGANPGTFVSDGNGRVTYTNFRNRNTTALGDIMGSDLVYSGSQDYGYAGSDADPDDEYADYLTDKAARLPLLLVGANDGMLHIIRADTGHTDSGKELMAYVPAGVYGRLNFLPDGGYTHKFYVNGKLTVGDAYLGGNWRTLAVGGLAQGGKTVFGLDISNPAATSATQIVKWEYNADGTDADMGYSFGKPSIVPLNAGWAAVFGNGYNSTNERAYLYVVDLDTGALIRRIATDTASSNGLSTPKLHDTDGNGIYDVAYAGDLQGNMWRFDLSSASSGSWSSRKLFAAGATQPITAQPAVSTHPLAPDVLAPSSSVLVYFGTGSYLTAADLTDADTQGIYAIWDNPADTSTVTKGQLLRQSFNPAITQTDGSLWRESSNDSIDWPTHRGWYVNLLAETTSPSGPSERIITSAKLIDANTGASYKTTYGKSLWRAIFTTAISKDDPCSSGGESWLMEFDLHSGGRPQAPVLDYSRDGKVTNRDSRGASDTNSDGKIDSDEAKLGTPMTGTKLLDMVVSDLEIIQYVPTETPDDEKDPEDPSKGALYKMASGVGGGLETAGGAQEGTEGAAGASPTPVRVFWRQIY